LAIRAAVGAGRLRLVRRLLTESLLLSLIGGALGLIAAKFGVKLLVAMSPDGIARIEESVVDGSVFGFTCTIAVLTGLLAGIFPAVQASKADLHQTLKTQPAAAGALSGRGGGERRGLPALMIAELALALVLLVGAGLMIKSFLRLLDVPKGFNPEGVLTLTLTPSLGKYPQDSPRRLACFEESLARVQALPGVQSAGLTTFLPLGGPQIRMFLAIEGRPPFEPGQEPVVETNHISADYFQTMGIQLRAGRAFTAEDRGGTPTVVVINENAGPSLLPWRESDWQTIVDGAKPSDDRRCSARRLSSRFGPGSSSGGYFPYMQHPNFYLMKLAVRVASGNHRQADPLSLAGLAASIRNQVGALEPNEPVNPVITMDESISESVAGRRFQMFLLGVFAAVALIIATVGIYGVISYAVSQRTHEIGIRMALGAQASDVLRMVVCRGMILALIGITVGLAAALALTRVMKTLLFEVSATDPETFALIALLLICVAVIASYIPARRATKIDPVLAIRHE
jgi:putative ABC transport system permease protein